MKLFFDADEMVNIRGCFSSRSPKRKQQIADYLAKEVEEGRKDSQILLTYLPFTTSIEVVYGKHFVELNPLSIRMEVSKEFVEFLTTE